MCHVELYCVQSVTAAAHNGTNIKWNGLREGVEKVVREWERREKKGKEETLKRNICFAFGCLISNSKESEECKEEFMWLASPAFLRWDTLGKSCNTHG